MMDWESKWKVILHECTYRSFEVIVYIAWWPAASSFSGLNICCLCEITKKERKISVWLLFVLLSRSSGSPRSRSSDSPRLRSKDSPRLRGREPLRSKAKRNCSKGTESPRSRGSHSPAAKVNDSSQRRDSPRQTASDAFHSSKLKESSSCTNQEEVSSVLKSLEPDLCVSDSSLIKGYNSVQIGENDSPHLECSMESLCQSQKISLSLSGSSESSQPKAPDKNYTPPFPPSSPSFLSEENLEVANRRAEAERLLEEAVSSWKEAQEVLQEVKELQSQTLRRQRRKTYEKMSVTPSAAAKDDTPTSPTSPEEDGKSETVWWEFLYWPLVSSPWEKQLFATWWCTNEAGFS